MKSIMTDVSETVWKKHVQDRYNDLDSRLSKTNPKYDGGCMSDESVENVAVVDEPVVEKKKERKVYNITDEDRIRRANQMKAYWANKRG